MQTPTARIVRINETKCQLKEAPCGGYKKGDFNAMIVENKEFIIQWNVTKLDVKLNCRVAISDGMFK